MLETGLRPTITIITTTAIITVATTRIFSIYIFEINRKKINLYMT